MGSICSCLCLENLEEYIHSDASMHGSCGCFRSLAQQLIHLCNVFVQREEVQAIPLVEQRINSSTSTIDNSTPETHHSPPRPLPCDDPRRPQTQHDGLINRCDKLSHLHEETVALRGSNMELSTAKCVGSNSEVASKLCYSKLNGTSVEGRRGVTYSFASYEDEDEDVCPTCLEEYTPENPKIVTKCFHHFHLSCIYEWKERSELCPVCGKVMVFDETW